MSTIDVMQDREPSVPGSEYKRRVKWPTRIGRSLRLKILLIVVGLAVVPSAIILITTSLAASGAMRAYIFEESTSRVYSVAEPLAGGIQAQVDFVEGLAEDQALASLIRRKLALWRSGAGRLDTDHYRDLEPLLAMPDDDVIYVVTERGAIGQLTNNGYAPVTLFPSPSAERDLVKAMQTASGETKRFVLESDAPPGMARFFAAAPLAGNELGTGQTIWLARPFDPLALFNVLRDRLGDQAMYLASSRAGVLGDVTADDEINQALRNDPDIFGQASGYTTQSDDKSIAYVFLRVGGFSNLTKLSGHPSSLVAIRRVETDEAMAALTYRVWQIVLVGLVFIGAVGLLGIWLSNRMVNPIKVLRAGFSRLERGDLDYRVEVKTGDELDDLAGSMNQMARTLQRTYQNLADKLLELDEQAKQLTLTYELAHAINRTLDLEQLFDIVTREVRSMMPAEVIALGLVTRDKQELCWDYVSPDEHAAFHRGIRTPMARSLSAQCLETEEVTLLEMCGVRNSPEGRLLEGHQLSALCLVPLETQQGHVGVLLLADPMAEAFRTRDTQILRRVSASLATAMEHGRLYAEQARFATELERQVLERTEALRQAQEKLVQTEKLAATGELAANVAHEINNPLSIIKNYLKLLQGQTLRRSELESQDSSVVNEGITIISEEIDRIARIVSQLQKVHSPDSPLIHTVELNNELAQLLQLFRHTFHQKRLVLESRYDDDLGPVEICSDHFRQILINILRNAYDATPPGGKILVESIANRPEAGNFTVRVMDTGPGIPAENLKHIFDPFFTTKKEKGSGLGLSVSYGLARNMGGRIEALSPQDGGCEFLLILPMRQLETGPQEIPKTPLVTRRGDRIIIG